MKKKLVCLLLALAMLLALAACSIGGETTEQPAEEEKTSTEQTPAAEETTEEAAETEQPAETLAETFADSSAKIGIMTTTVTSSEEQFRLATQIQEKYGADKIIVQTYPDACRCFQVGESCRERIGVGFGNDHRDCAVGILMQQGIGVRYGSFDRFP